MGSPLVLTLPMPPSFANASGQSRHWRTIRRKKIAYLWDCDKRQVAGLIPPPPATPYAKVRVSATMYVGAEHDDDNAMVRAYKLPLDWLKTRGYIVDDKRKCVRCEVPEQIVKRDGNYRVELTITPVES